MALPSLSTVYLHLGLAAVVPVDLWCADAPRGHERFSAGRAHRVGCRWLPDTRRKAPYIRLETKFYAELAGVSHGFESYAELAASGIVSKLDIMRPITEEAVYELTHTIFYLSDFGFWNMDLPPAECERTLRFIERLTDKCVQCDYWDMTGELIWTQFCLDGDPVHSASGTAGIRRLRQVQLANGAIPGRSAGRRPEKSATPVEFFRKVYHTTLVTALVSRVLSSAPQTV